ncbi:MAG: bifunctional demethylmenaquinone methyltransferase/2-methoxy-6-polyprenyl-1,4-benzoquinol methylase UbiE [Deltaproteobacteria bacterium]|nr:bifunctional demethylmenaquinone methyltransferase/2-methoxy-6-polyprenyl-1,4-benzoquinol methylase UbiE [Deltaproteobacteria bacterium]
MRNKRVAEKMNFSQAGKDQEEMAYFGYRRIPAAEKVKWVVRHFNSIAREYDSMNTLLSFGLHHLWKRAAVKALGLRAGDRVIDVCGGTADLSILAAKAVGPEGWVILYDINRAMMEAGRPKVAKASLTGRVLYVLGDAEHISFAAGQFDAAIVGFGIRNLTRMEKGLEEMFRVLKPGGKLMCLEFSRPATALCRWLYDMYSFQIMPLAGRIFAGSRQAYTYLPESIRLFPLPQELAVILKRVGFGGVTYRNLTNGIAVVHLGVKA